MGAVFFSVLRCYVALYCRSHCAFYVVWALVAPIFFLPVFAPLWAVPFLLILNGYLGDRLCSFTRFGGHSDLSLGGYLFRVPLFSTSYLSTLTKVTFVAYPLGFPSCIRLVPFRSGGFCGSCPRHSVLTLPVFSFTGLYFLLQFGFDRCLLLLQSIEASIFHNLLPLSRLIWIYNSVNLGSFLGTFCTTSCFFLSLHLSEFIIQ